MQEIDVKIVLQPKQLEAFEYIENGSGQYLMYGGAKGGGKSYLVRVKEIVRRMKYPNTYGVIIRKTHPELMANHIRKILVEFPFISDWYKSGEKAIYYPNGSVTEFKHLDSTHDVYNYQGIEYDDITIDEATQHEEEVFKVLKTSLRSDPKLIIPGFHPCMLLTGNPGGIGHAWVERLFVNREFEEDKEDPEDYHFIQAKIWDNPIFLAANPKYLKNLEDLPDDLRRAYLDGDWTIFAGQYFKKLREKKHLIEPISLQPDWVRFRALDWGHAHYSACLWGAVDWDRNVYIYRTLKAKETSVGKLARMIVAATPPDENVIMTLAGHDLWVKDKTDELYTNQTLAKRMGDNGLHLTLANTDRIHGWQSVREYLDWDEEYPTPQCRIFDKPDCRNLFDSLKRMIHDEHNTEDAKKMDGDDEADALRYLLMHIFHKHRTVRPKSEVEKLIDRLHERSDKKKVKSWQANL